MTETSNQASRPVSQYETLRSAGLCQPSIVGAKNWVVTEGIQDIITMWTFWGDTDRVERENREGKAPAKKAFKSIRRDGSFEVRAGYTTYSCSGTHFSTNPQEEFFPVRGGFKKGGELSFVEKARKTAPHTGGAIVQNSSKGNSTRGFFIFKQIQFNSRETSLKVATRDLKETELRLHFTEKGCPEPFGGQYSTYISRRGLNNSTAQAEASEITRELSKTRWPITNIQGSNNVVDTIPNFVLSAWAPLTKS